MAYLKWDTVTIDDFSDSNITSKYDNGYVFTRKAKGIMNQTRSLRINLKKFNLHTKNKRVMRKTEDLKYVVDSLPMAEESYSWQIHKLGKDYYETKFGKDIFSANKIKELILDGDKSNYNSLIKYSTEKDEVVGYCICYENEQMMHYAYPFYNLDKYINHYGMGMMLRAILYAQEKGKDYFYLGSVSRPADIYKLYFRGLEWFDGSKWSEDIEVAKELISVVD